MPSASVLLFPSSCSVETEVGFCAVSWVELEENRSMGAGEGDGPWVGGGGGGIVGGGEFRSSGLKGGAVKIKTSGNVGVACGHRLLLLLSVLLFVSCWCLLLELLLNI